MSVVIDSSVTLAWIYSDERTEATERVFDIVTEAGDCDGGQQRFRRKLDK